MLANLSGHAKNLLYDLNRERNVSGSTRSVYRILAGTEYRRNNSVGRRLSSLLTHLVALL